MGDRARPPHSDPDTGHRRGICLRQPALPDAGLRRTPCHPAPQLNGSFSRETPMTAPATVRNLLAWGADDATAITAPSAIPLTYAGLREQSDETIVALNAVGIGRSDRVAIVLANGPEMAVAFLSIASGVTSAPLNPQYRPDEFEFYLTDLNARALVVEAGAPSAALDIAAKLDVPVITRPATPPTRARRYV